MTRFFDLLHTFSIQFDVKTKHYTCDELRQKGDQTLKELENSYWAPSFSYIMNDVLRADYPPQGFFVVEEVTFSYQGRTMLIAFTFFEAMTFNLPLVENAFDHPQHLFDALMAIPFLSPYSLMHTKYEPLEACIQQTKQLEALFGDQYKELFDAFVVYEREENEEETE